MMQKLLQLQFVGYATVYHIPRHNSPLNYSHKIKK